MSKVLLNDLIELEETLKKLTDLLELWNNLCVQIESVKKVAFFCCFFISFLFQNLYKLLFYTGFGLIFAPFYCHSLVSTHKYLAKIYTTWFVI